LDHGSVDDTAIIWDVKQETPSARLKGHTGDVNAANGSAVITASDDDTIKLWRASDGAFRYADRPYR
jgi:WD40 repeat protein